VLGRAVTRMTSKLLIIYAFNAFVCGQTPSIGQVESYLNPPGTSPPLDWHHFPQIIGDIQVTQRAVVGNPMYDPAGMVIALLALAATPSQRAMITEKLQVPKALMDPNIRRMAMLQAMNGLPLDHLQHDIIPTLERANSIERIKSDLMISMKLASPMPRVLFLTNAGDGVNSEAALWLLSKHLDAFPTFQVDVVFVTGNTMQRSMRWAGVLSSLPKGPKPGAASIQYFLAPNTTHSIRYCVELDQHKLADAGMAELSDSPFMGGNYDIVVQGSPLYGFDKNFSKPVPDLEGSLGRIDVNTCTSMKKLYIIIGTEGATNCPKDLLHQGFKKHLEAKGFAAVHVDGRHLVHWDRDMLACMPPKLASMVTDDEWNKVVGRISPSAGTLLTRFRVNTTDNYAAVNKAWMAFESANSSHPAYAKVIQWWKDIASDIWGAIKNNYVKLSRAADNAAGKAAFGNPKLGDLVKGMPYTWEAVMHGDCGREMALVLWSRDKQPLNRLTVDDALVHAVTMMTSKLLRIYAFDEFSGGRTPDSSLVMAYLSGSTPMQFHTFPRLFRDITVFKRRVLGSPMYGPSGVLLALMTIIAHAAGSAKDATPTSVLPRRTQPRLSVMVPNDLLTKAMLKAYQGEGPEQMATMLQAFHTLVDILPNVT